MSDPSAQPQCGTSVFIIYLAAGRTPSCSGTRRSSTSRHYSFVLENDTSLCVTLDYLAEELGLENLLQRMPAGMWQMVGETGWQLSHGERSRLYIARALLQGSDLGVLDESFASLDPETLLQSFRCVLRRAPTVLVIAHP